MKTAMTIFLSLFMLSVFNISQADGGGKVIPCIGPEKNNPSMSSFTEDLDRVSKCPDYAIAPTDPKNPTKKTAPAKKDK